MREILFRGKRMDNGEWIEGSLYTTRDNAYHAQICVGSTTIRVNFDVNPATVGQYTGQKDKNGKKIFEGDIVAWTVVGEKFTGVIEYADEAFGIRTNDGWPFLFFVGEIEKIGNRWDNPELLDGGKNGE